MKLLIFCRRAKELARRVLHGWYEKSLTVEDLLAEADGGRFTWIGAGAERAGCCAAGPGLLDMQRAQDELPALTVEEEIWHFQPLAPDAGLVFGRFRLATAPESGLVLSEQQRATFLFRAEGNAVRLCHVHISSPAGRKRRTLYAFEEPAVRRDYMGELAARRLGDRFPELTKRQVKVLCFLMQGLPYKDIADAMNITPRTVRYYVTEIERRLRVENRTLLIEKVLQRNTGGVISIYGYVRQKTLRGSFFVFAFPGGAGVLDRHSRRAPLWFRGVIKKIYTGTSGTAVEREVKKNDRNSYNLYRFIVVSWQTTKEGGICMNQIYKVVWSKARHQYVVASELAKSVTKGAGSRAGKAAAAVLAAVVLTAGAGMTAQAKEVTLNGSADVRATGYGWGVIVAETTGSANATLTTDAVKTVIEDETLDLGTGTLTASELKVGTESVLTDSDKTEITTQMKAGDTEALATANAYTDEQTKGVVKWDKDNSEDGYKEGTIEGVEFGGHGALTAGTLTATEYQNANGTFTVNGNGKITASAINSPTDKFYVDENGNAEFEGWMTIGSELTVNGNERVHGQMTADGYHITQGTGDEAYDVFSVNDSGKLSAATLSNNNDTFTVDENGNLKAAGGIVSGSVAEGSVHSMALGEGARVAKDSDFALAIGYNARASHDNALAVGHSAAAGSEGSVAIGNSAYANYGLNAIALGNHTRVTGTAAVAVGEGSKAAGDEAAAFGAGSNAAADHSVALGAGTIADEENTVAVGGRQLTQLANADFVAGSTDAVTAGQLYAAGIVPGTVKDGSKYAIALGMSSVAAKENSIAMGYKATAGSYGSIAIGENAKVSNAIESMALGQDSYVYAANAVALGAGSIADEADTVSVGRKGEERKITNVADGVYAHDAVNMSQLEALSSDVDTKTAGVVKWDEDDSEDGYKEGTLKGVEFKGDGDLAVKDLTADTISAAEGRFTVDEYGNIAAHTYGGSDGEGHDMPYYYFNMDQNEGISFGYTTGASLNVSENGTTFTYGDQSTVINGNTIDTGTATADKVIAGGMYVGSESDGNAVVTKDQLTGTVSTATEGMVQWDKDDNGNLTNSINGVGLEDGKITAEKGGTIGGVEFTGDGDLSTTGDITGGTVTGGTITATDNLIIGTGEGAINVGDKLDAIDDSIKTVSGDVSTIKTDVEGVKTEIGVNPDGTYKTIENGAADVISGINQNTTDISGIKDQIGAADEAGLGLTNKGGEAGTLVGGINANTTAIDKNKTAISGIQSQIGTGTVTATGADGKTYANITEAVNGNNEMIHQNTAAIQQQGQAIDSLGHRMSDLGEEVDDVGAISAALAGLHPLDYDGTGSKFQISAAMGTYDGTQAAAIGGFYHFNEDVMLSLAGSTVFEDSHKTAANVGVTFRVGPGGSEKKAAPEDVMAKLEAMEQKMQAMDEKIAALEAENQQLKGEAPAAEAVEAPAEEAAPAAEAAEAVEAPAAPAAETAEAAPAEAE